MRPTHGGADANVRESRAHGVRALRVPVAAAAVEENGRLRVGHAMRHLRLEEALRIADGVAHLDELELAVLLEHVGEEDRPVVERLPRRPDEVLAPHAEGGGHDREAVRLAELEVVDTDAEHLGVALRGRLAVDLEHAIRRDVHLREAERATRRMVPVRAQRTPWCIGLEEGDDRGVGDHLAVDVQERRLLRRVRLVVGRAAADGDEPLVLRHHAEEELLLLVAKRIVDHERDVALRGDGVRARTELLACAGDCALPCLDRALREVLAEADADLEVSGECTEDGGTPVDAVAIDLAAGRRPDQSHPRHPSSHRTVQGRMIAVPRREERQQLG